MKQILVLGAGKSSTVLISYLLAKAPANGWHVHVADINGSLAASKIAGDPNASAHRIDPFTPSDTDNLIAASDLVISLLPPPFHPDIARICLSHGKHFLNASYVSPEIMELDKEARSKGLTFLCEMGLDPGIDHMSAMEVIDRIKEEGGVIHSFRSHCGGLVAPESDDNPWHYKISWNPRNVVMAGKDGAVYRENGATVNMEYAALFDQNRTIEIPGVGRFAWYPNRDSLSYMPTYGLEGIPTFVRTTLRHPDFCLGWKNLIDLKLTDETVLYDTDGMSLSAFFQIHFDRFGFSEWLQQTISTHFNHTRTHLEDLISLMEAEIARPEEEKTKDAIMLVNDKGDLRDFSARKTRQDVASGIAVRMHEAKLALSQLFYLGLDSGDFINIGKRSAADVLQWILEKRLALGPLDKDMIIMMHEFGYEQDGHQKKATSSLILKGSDQIHTAMAKTVGLPLGIAAGMILSGQIRERGVIIPIHKSIYGKVLPALEKEGIVFCHGEG